jgi:hypothetical protein
MSANQPRIKLVRGVRVDIDLSTVRPLFYFCHLIFEEKLIM